MTGNRARMPAAMPMPPSRPAADATSATTPASASVAPTTWRREAPRARNSAFSRVRWATTMAKVLWMEKVATSRRVVNRLRNCPEIISWFSSADRCPVIASTPDGRTARSESTSSRWLVPGPARTWMLAAWPRLAVRYFSASALVIPV